MVVELEGQGLEEGDVVGHDLLVGEVKLVNDDGVDVVVGQQVICDKEKTVYGLSLTLLINKTAATNVFVIIIFLLYRVNRGLWA